MSIPVGLSTASVMPGSVEDTFAMAAELGYDGVEIMVLTAPESREPRLINALSRKYGLPVHAIHAPTLLLTQGVWGRDPWEKVDRSVDLAGQVGADVVVLHPPFRWQRKYARQFVDAVAEREATRDGVRLAVENMFTWQAQAGGAHVKAYSPGWDPTEHDYGSVTIDLSHAATSGMDAEATMAMVRSLGKKLAHLHLTDGSGTIKDEHLVPGHGNQPCAEVLAHLRDTGFGGSVVVEINTRSVSSLQRRTMCMESLRFAREHLAADRAG
ncbi:sugar phosphate isomerase/epimerase family protein [Georgenia sp. Z1491]|uniref:sugar phosphate isomerase/epimerase family protein n=1 Tax=Georgenia sp. Z1491 TaxID=3416707 RepID=UPI003CF33C0D